LSLPCLPPQHGAPPPPFLICLLQSMCMRMCWQSLPAYGAACSSSRFALIASSRLQCSAAPWSVHCLWLSDMPVCSVDGPRSQLGAVGCLNHQALRQPCLLPAHRVTHHDKTRFAATQVYIHAMWLDNECHGAAWKDTYYAVVPPQSNSKVPLAASLKPALWAAWRRFGPLSTMPCVQQAVVTHNLQLAVAQRQPVCPCAAQALVG